MGLATGCLIIAGTAFTVLCYVAGHHGMAEYLAAPYFAGAGELSVLFGAMVGGAPRIPVVQLLSRSGLHGRHRLAPDRSPAGAGGRYLVIRQEV